MLNRRKVNDTIDTVIFTVVPWQSPMLGVARSALAFGSFMTLAATPRDVVFFPSPNFPHGFVCSPPTDVLVPPCLIGGTSTVWRYVLIVVFLVVAVGWRPRVTAWFHWFATLSFVTATPIPDGGDHLSLVLVTLLLPICVADDRVWHWHWGNRNLETIRWQDATHSGCCFIWRSLSRWVSRRFSSRQRLC